MKASNSLLTILKASTHSLFDRVSGFQLEVVALVGAVTHLFQMKKLTSYRKASIKSQTLALKKIDLDIRVVLLSSLRVV